VEADELASARKRIAQLDAELALTREASELFYAQAVVPQNADARSLTG
jgi:transposase